MDSVDIRHDDHTFVLYISDARPKTVFQNKISTFIFQFRYNFSLVS